MAHLFEGKISTSSVSLNYPKENVPLLIDDMKPLIVLGPL